MHPSTRAGATILYWKRNSKCDWTTASAALRCRRPVDCYKLRESSFIEGCGTVMAFHDLALALAVDIEAFFSE